MALKLTRFISGQLRVYGKYCSVEILQVFQACIIDLESVTHSLKWNRLTQMML